jgi:hypothetical protein
MQRLRKVEPSERYVTFICLADRQEGERLNRVDIHIEVGPK